MPSKSQGRGVLAPDWKDKGREKGKSGGFQGEPGTSRRVGRTLGGGSQSAGEQGAERGLDRSPRSLLHLWIILRMKRVATVGCLSGKVGGNASQKASTREERNAIS